ncbi:hypothetical protein [Nonomuraea sp. KM88]|uniref:hypothetical protein n=1 Tax=Nonomuraea sp. KM88 TaxID=3457427 RepID=UPI003FCC8EAC
MRKTGRGQGTSTTRQEIVAAADGGANPALVRRFFGGMEQLFSAVVAEVFQTDRAVVTLLDGPRGALGRRLLTYVPSPLAHAVRAELLVAAGPDQLAGWVAPTLQRYLTGRAQAGSHRAARPASARAGTEAPARRPGHHP